MSGELIIEVLRFAVSGVLVTGGLVLIVGGAIGVLRFPDFFTRLHAASAADGAGAALVALGLAAGAAEWSVAVKLLLLAALIVALTPTLAQLGANSAHAAGLAPLSGRYVAPRPGMRKDPDA